MPGGPKGAIKTVPIPDQMRQAVARIKAVLSDNWCPEAEQTINQEINHLVGIMANHQEKIRSLRGWVEILYSAQKYKRYGGPAAVRVHVQADCDSIRRIADQIGSAGQ